MRFCCPPFARSNPSRTGSRVPRIPRTLLLVALAQFGAMALAAPVDSIGQRVLACTGCHDDVGRIGKDAYYPRIAGKPEGYLYNQLVNFREGRRFYGLMTYLVDPLPDPYLREMAAHFAKQSPPYPEPARPGVAPDVLERGRTLAVSGDPAQKLPACAECHGTSLMGVVPAMPGLLALPREYLTAQLASWKAGTRKALAPDCMAELAARLSTQDIGAVAAWLASQPVPKGAKAEPVAPAKLPVECGSVSTQVAAPSR